MFNFIGHPLPVSFTQLLRMNTHDSKMAHRNIVEHFYNTNLGTLVNIHFSKKADGKGLEYVLHHEGYEEVRNFLAALYFHTILGGKITESPNIYLASEVASYAEKLKPYEVPGNQFSYLFFFYIKMIELAQKSKDKDQTIQRIPESIFLILKEVKVRSERVDILFLNLWHFQSFYGDSKLREVIQQKGSIFQQLVGPLDHHKKEFYYSSLLSYLYSIHDQDFFKDFVL